MVAIPLTDADPVTLALVLRKDNPNPLADAIVVAAENLAQAGTKTRSGERRRQGLSSAESPL